VRRLYVSVWLALVLAVFEWFGGFVAGHYWH
jgi:hypothetical protein